MSTATYAPVTPHPDSLWLRVGWDVGSQVFEFPAGNARAIAVGSSRTCDVRVRQRGLAPVCFCFERERDCILIVPMSDGDLRVAGVSISRPKPVQGSATIEFGGATVSASVLTDAAEETEPTSELPTRETVSSHLKRLPDDVDPTWVPTAALKIERLAEPLRTKSSPNDDVAALPTEVMPVFEFWDDETRNAAVELPASTSDSSAAPAPRASVSTATMEFGTAALFLHAATRDTAPEQQLERPASPPMLLGDPAVSTQDTTSFDLPAVNVPASPVDPGEPARRQTRSAIHRRPRQFRTAVLRSVTRLGVIAARRPLRVAGVALATAFTLVFVLLGVRKLASAKRNPAPTTAASVVPANATAPRGSSGLAAAEAVRAQEKHAPAPSASPASAAIPSVSATTALAPPNPVVGAGPFLPASEARATTSGPVPPAPAAPTPSVAASSPPTPRVGPAATSAASRAHAVARAAVPADSDALAALKDVIDGRDADALQAYSALAARSPNNPAYRALVRLLQRRAREGCDKPAAMPASCPDIKR